MMHKVIKRLFLFALLAIAATIFFVACDENEAASLASCSILVGDGTGGTDADIKDIMYPGETFHRGSEEDSYYVPCNSRTLIINDGTETNASGQLVGDRHQPIEARTKTGVPVLAEVSGYWTLNQNRNAMEAFWGVCLKFKCASNNDISGDSNFATDGWNGMLAEQFTPALERAVKIAIGEAPDTIWSTYNQKEYDDMANRASEVFADEARRTSGFSMDLFCGSGNSAWRDPNNPGHGEFTCSPVRIVIDEVYRGEVDADDNNEGVKALNQQRLENAQALYGTWAGFWLGVQDTVSLCESTSTPCVINLGGGSSSPSIPIPDLNSVPTPVPTPEEDEDD